jgi:CSLREA domain-containing protein
MPAVQVAIQDALGNLVADATDAVTVAIGTNPGGGTLSGTATVNAVAGVGSFTDLTIDQVGTGYTLVANSGSLTSATSAAFDILDFTVNTTDDVDDGTCNATHCSLREAINAANVNAGTDGTDVIEFNIPGVGPHTIQPGFALPTISDPVVIDGTTEPDVVSTPIIELDGSNAGNVHGLTITGPNSTVRGLVINRFSLNGVEISGASAVGNVIQGNFIGTDVTGSNALGNGLHGVSVVRAPGNTVGGTTSAARNVISGNGIFGVGIIFANATGNLVQGNFIGIDVTGTAAVGNGNSGVSVDDAPNNTVGGTAAGTRNIISGNDVDGVLIRNVATGNLVQGNFIGTDVTGTAPLGNASDGVHIILGANSNTIGGTTAAARNVISGNAANGVGINGIGTSGNLVQGNFIGTDVTGTAAIGNGNAGVLVGDAANNTIGGTTAGARNIIAGNLEGVTFDAAGGNLVQGNYIGTDVTGTFAIGNSVGVLVIGSGNTIGGATTGADNTIAFNTGPGLNVNSGTGNAILSNSIFSNADLAIDLGAQRCRGCRHRR